MRLDDSPAKIRVLFVCLGNICRSPTAEGVFRQQVRALGLDDRVEIDSCGTGGWHIGEPPDARAQQAAKQRGIDISGLRGRQLCQEDFTRFDVVLAMDHDNLAELERRMPADSQASIGLLMEWAGEPGAAVPDPYYEGGFDRVYAMIERASQALAAELEQRLEAAR